jgi:putative ABC transport system permease protein
MSQFFRQLGWLIGRRKKEDELKDELNFHLDEEAEARKEGGLSEQEARYAAKRDLGNVTLVKDDTRSAWGWVLLEQFWQDLRYGFRGLRKSPGFTAVAVLTLALGIGANTAIFSLIDAVMLRMLPVQNPEQLVLIKFQSPLSAYMRQSATNPLWEQARDHQDAFSGVIAWAPETFNLAEGGEVRDIHGIYASGDYFTVLGVRPAAGRLLLASDDVRGCGGVAVLGYGFWQSRYAGAQSAVGSLIWLNGHPFPIIGVAQPGFFGTEIGTPFDIVIPVCAEAILDGKDSMLDERSSWWLEMMGRLSPGEALAQADARMKVLSPELFGAVVPQDYTAKLKTDFRSYRFVVLPGATGASGIRNFRERYSRPLAILMFVVGLVLLIACANIASLLLARSAARRHELAVRCSLGASRARLIRQVLTESMVLSGAGALLGILFARWGSAVLVRFVSTQRSEVFLDIQIDGRVLAFTVAIAVLCCLLFGTLPALRSTRMDPTSAMKDDQGRGAGSRSQSSAARWIVAVQVALSMILLVVTGLFIRTFTNLMVLNPGFDRNNVLLVETNVHYAGLPEPALAPLYGQMLARLQTLPGVLAASQSLMMPLGGGQWDNYLTIPNQPLPPGVDPDVLLNWVTPDFFSTMRTPILQGRAFDARDSAVSTPVVIVNQLLARRFFPGENPIGKHLLENNKSMTLSTQPMEIIGVTQDAKYTSLREEFEPEAYFPLAQIRAVSEQTTFEIRTAMTPGALIPAVRDAMSGVNRSASLQFVTLKQEADDSVLQEHLLALLSGFFGGLALLLTAIGLYGVMAYVVTLRTRELGIRMALGAQKNAILRLVMRDAAIVLVAGIVAGLVGSVWITPLVRQLLFGLSANDPSTLVLAIAALAGIGLVATYIPARRASRVDPMTALRHE